VTDEQYIDELRDWITLVVNNVLQPLSCKIEGGLGAIAEGYCGAAVNLLSRANRVPVQPLAGRQTNPTVLDADFMGHVWALGKRSNQWHWVHYSAFRLSDFVCWLPTGLMRPEVKQ
jgi:hypothetical protein